MTDELWDLSGTIERMAVAMWSHEAWRCQRFRTAQKRTVEAFRLEAPELQEKWKSLAAAALEAIFMQGETP